MAFPTSLTNAVDNSTDVLAAHLNNVEAKVGIDGSAVTTSHDYKLSAVTGTAKAVSTAGNQSVAGVKDFTDSIKTDTIAESTSTAGVTIDGLKIKDTGFALGSDADGDLYYRASGVLTRLGKGTAAQVLTMNSGATAPEWAAASSGADGYISAGETWTYASASTFTVSGDVTAKYHKGTKIKWTQTSVRYGHVASSSYSAPNTTVTIVVNDDYVIANAAISDNYYSYQDRPQGFPTSFTFSPTYTGFSAAPTATLEYMITNGWCHVNLATGTGTSNSADFDITMPIAKGVAGYSYFIIGVFDNGSWQNVAGIAGLTNSATLELGKTISTLAGNAFAGFTTSSTKAAQISIFYPI